MQTPILQSGRSTTAREVVDGSIPGGLSIFIRSVDVTRTDGEVVSVDPDTNIPITDSPGGEVELSVTVENKGSTDGGIDIPFTEENPDSCDFSGDGDGTEVTVVATTPSGGFETDTLCIEDLFNRNTPATEDFTLTVPLRNEESDYNIELWAEGTNTETRVTPKYGIPMQLVSGGGGEDPRDPGDDDGSGIIVRPPEYIELGEARFQNVVNAGSDIRFDVDIVSNWGAVDGAFAPGTHPDYCAAGTFNVRPGGNVTAEVSVVGWASDSSSVCVSSAEDITQIQTQLTAPTTPGTYDVQVELKGTVSGEAYGTRTYPSSLTVPEEEDPDLGDPSDDPDPGEDDSDSDGVGESIGDFLDDQFGDLIPGVGGSATALGILFGFVFLLVLLSSVTSSVTDAVNPVS